MGSPGIVTHNVGSDERSALRRAPIDAPRLIDLCSGFG
jgi:hypothetical protein